MAVTEFLINIISSYNALLRLTASDFNLTISQALHVLSIPFDGIPMSQLAKKLGLDSSTLTRNIYKLQNIGLVMRKSDNYDKRIKIIALTRAGHNINKQLINKINEINYDIMSQLSIDDKESITQSIERFSWAIDCERENE